MDSRQQQIYEEFMQHDDWYIKSFHGRVLPFFVQALSVQKMLRTYDWSQRYGGNITSTDDMHTWFWKKSEMLRQRKEFIERVLSDTNFLDTFEQAFFANWENYLRIEEQYKKRYTGVDVKEMVESLVDLIQAERNAAHIGYMNDCFLSFGDTDWIIEWIDKELPNDVEHREQIVADLVVPLQPSFVQQEEIERMRIAMQKQGQWDLLLEQHAAHWSWIEQSYFESDPLTQDDFLQKVQKVQQDHGAQLAKVLAAADTSIDRKRQRKQEIYNTYKLTEELQRIINLSDRISHITDLRKMGVLRINELIFSFLRDLSNLTKQPFELLGWTMDVELEDIILGEKWGILRERQESGQLVLFLNGEKAVYQGDDFTALNLRPFTAVDEAITSVKGQVAYTGVVEGTAKIIRGRQDFDTFEKGDILITNQTTPEFVPIMKRAAAVVTEQGGITCHAAIVSRELKIPCIIGAQSAMQIFQNREVVVVDAEAGEVRKQE